MRIRLLFSIIVALASAALSRGADMPFRTDGGDEKLQWFRVQPGEFPPAGSAHAISGELISVDHVNRSGAAAWTARMPSARMSMMRRCRLPCCPMARSAFTARPADLRDVPLGTHLHGQFYVEDKGGKQVFSLALRLEDDFTWMAQQQRLWRIDSVEPNKGLLLATGVGPSDSQPDAKATKFQISPATRIWKEHGIGALSDLAAGQTVLLNLTVCTLKGPGRCTDIWLDPDSRAVATALQLEVHRQYQREHGLAARVDEVDNQHHVVTMTIFGGIDASLMANFRLKEHIAAAVAEETLRTHDQTNDTARGPIVEVLEVPVGPGNSGVRVRFQPSELLEGYRPKRIVRLFWGGWPIDDLPREERAYDG